MDALDTTLTDDPATLLRASPAPPSALVIFGAGGDLTRRLLMPALYNLAVAGLLDDRFRILGVDRVAGDDESFRVLQTANMQSFLAERGGNATPGSLDQTSLSWVRRRLSYQSGDFDAPETFEAIGKWIDGASAVFYLAVADRFFGPVIDRLAEAKLLDESDDSFRRVVIEKPFGHDLPSAKALNARILKVLDETQIFRIDHFLGKETVQNIMALRFGNGIFEPLWQRDHIDYVEITAAETVGVEARARFYEPTGALRDMVPNHMFQLLAMTAMEAPNSFDADAVRAEKAKVIEAIRPLNGAQVRDCVIRGQYDEAGHRQLALGGGAVLPAHRQAPGDTADRGGGAFQAGAVRDVPRHAGQPPGSQHHDAAHPADRGHQPAVQRQGAGAAGAAGAGDDGHALLRLLQHGQRHRLRNPALRRADRRRDAVPARRQHRGRLARRPADPGCLVDRHDSGAALHSRQRRADSGRQPACPPRASLGAPRMSDAEALRKQVLIVMGVSGSGKTTIAEALDRRLGWPFQEGDDLHPPANVAKMHAGTPLTDEDRWPWLDAIAAWIGVRLADDGAGVVTCSALKRSYRDRLVGGRDGVRLVYLHASAELLRERLAARKGHFMPASLLNSQLEAFEEPGPDENPIRIEDAGTPDQVADAIMAALRAG